MLLICFALGFDSSEEKKCCVSRAYAVCWVTPNFWENALTDEKKNAKEKRNTAFTTNQVYQIIRFPFKMHQLPIYYPCTNLT